MRVMHEGRGEVEERRGDPDTCIEEGKGSRKRAATYGNGEGNTLKLGACA